MNCHQHVRPELTQLPTLLRLRQAGRYAIVVQNRNGTIAPSVYWTEIQALLATGIPRELWSCVGTEVFSMIHRDDLPPGALLFAKQARRKQILSVVAWGTNGINPVVYDSCEEAAAALEMARVSEVENSSKVARNC